MSSNQNHLYFQRHAGGQDQDFIKLLQFGAQAKLGLVIMDYLTDFFLLLLFSVLR